jgi:hypothetical protein
VGGLAENLLDVRDEVRLRDALRLYRIASAIQPRLDNAGRLATARSRAQTALAAVARDRDPHRRAQALTLLGVLAGGAVGQATDRTQVDAAESDFGDVACTYLVSPQSDATSRNRSRLPCSRRMACATRTRWRSGRPHLRGAEGAAPSVLWDVRQALRARVGRRLGGVLGGEPVHQDVHGLDHEEEHHRRNQLLRLERNPKDRE